ncbi:MAG: VCBS domain-containing protein [Mariprofundaceae bacterium]|nr:VCBS domain-containing protein [Mariprofundaceae bacterium]
MATNIELKQFADAVYNPTSTPLPSGWSLIRQSDPNNTGYDGAAFGKFDAAGNLIETVIAHGGTEPLSFDGDLTADIQILKNRLPDQYEFARRFYGDVVALSGGASITITGHSLGGSIAQLQGAETGLPTTTFNPLGAKDQIPVLNDRYGLGIDPNATQGNVTNHRTLLDPVSLMPGAEHIGDMQTHVAPSEVVVWGVASAIGRIPVVAPAAATAGAVWAHGIGRFGEILDPGSIVGSLIDVGKITIKAGVMYVEFTNGIKQAIADGFDAIQRWLQPRRDPLTLDLNGNGLETVAPSTPPLLFDHLGNGIKQSSGWIAPDDGFLVLDRNGNGTIDSGAELFGDSTPLATGGNAVDGFDALAQEDSNADGVVDAQDANWANLQVWQDANQDGFSQSGELSSLDQLGITGINVDSTLNSQVLANGNQIADLGTFTYADGRTGSAGTTGGMADINLAVDTFHRTFADTIPLTPEAALLPDMQGSGMVRDLREATSMTTAEGAALQASLSGYAQANTREVQLAQLDAVISDWGATSGFGDIQTRATENGYTLTTNLDVAHQQRLTALEQFNGRSFFRMPWESGTAASGVTGLAVGVGGDPKHIQTSFSAAQINLLDQAYSALRGSVYDALLPQTRLKPYLDQVGLTFTNGQLVLDFTGVEAAFNDASAIDAETTAMNLVEFNRYTQTMFKDTTWASRGWEFLGSTLSAATMTPAIESALNTFGINFDGQGSANANVIIGNDGGVTVTGLVGRSETLVGGNGDDVLQSWATSPFYGIPGQDTLLGGAGNDTLYGLRRNDVLVGGTGDDTLYGGEGNDTYRYNLGDGTDTIMDEAWSGANTLAFGPGINANNITIQYDTSGGTPNIILDLGNGDSINIGRRNDLAVQNLTFADGTSMSTQDFIGTNEQIIVDPGVTAAMVTPHYDAVMQTIQFDFGNGTVVDAGISGDMPFKALQFSDGTSVVADTLIKEQLIHQVGSNVADSLNGWDVAGYGDYLQGMGGNDVLNGGGGDDRIEGGAGDDTLTGGDGADVIIGGAGNDVIDGGMGNNIIDGGTGNDTLVGGYGSDTYLFNIGDGTDAITDIGNNRLQFGPGISLAMITPRYDHVTGQISLELGGSDSIVIGSYDQSQKQFNLSVSGLTLEDGSYHSMSSLLFEKGLPIAGTDAADTLTGIFQIDNSMSGMAGDDLLTGGLRNDTLDGGSGNDTIDGSYDDDVLTGGLGNDTLIGGEGSDVYVYNLGDGSDTIIDTRAAGQTLRFGAGVSVNRIEYANDPDGGSNGTLKLRLNSWNGEVISIEGVSRKLVDSPIQQFEFADGTVQSIRQLLDAHNYVEINGTPAFEALQGTSYNDAIYGDDRDDALLGGDGDDELDGGGGNDTLDGGSGSDYLYGSGGNDILYGRTGDDELEGGMGNDTLAGGTGNDTYNFYADTLGWGEGDGQDRIFDSSGNDTLFIDGGWEGLTEADLSFSKSGVDLKIGVANSSDSVTVDGWFAGTSTLNTIEFRDGSTLDLTTIGQGAAGEAVVGTAANDMLVGSLYKDALEGGQGNDTLIGGIEDDVYRFNLGDGVDEIYELSATSNPKGNDVIEFGAGITPDMLSFDSEVITDHGSRWAPSEFQFPDPQADLMVGDEQRQVMTIQVGDQGDAIRSMSGKGAIEKFRFADGSEYSWQELVELNGGALVVDSNDSASTWNEWNGTAYVPVTRSPYRMLDGTGFAASFNGGIGDDTMLGGKLGDIYTFNPGDGEDVIADFGGIDGIAFGAGIAAQDVVWQYDPNGPTPFVLQVGTNGDLIAILDGEKGVIERFSFDDGTVLSFDELIAQQGGITLIPPTTADQTIWPTYQYSNSLIVGGDGADMIEPDGDANNLIAPGKGDDTVSMNGWSGDANTLLLNLGDGSDTLNIEPYSKPWMILFGGGVDPASVKVEVETIYDEWDEFVLQQNMLISYGDQGDEIYIDGATPNEGEGGGDAPSVRVKFADGTEWSYEDLLAHEGGGDGSGGDWQPVQEYFIAPQTGEHFIIGGPGGTDTVNLQWDWNETSALSGLDVVDQTTLEDQPFDLQVVATESASASYQLTMDNGNLSAHFDNGVVQNIAGVDSSDPLGSSPIRNFNFANGVVVTIDQLLANGVVETVGSEFADSLTGTAVNDHIDAGAGDDVITGGQGNDALAGGIGNDSYIYNAGDGADIIVDSNGHWEGWSFVADTNQLSLGAGINPVGVSIKYDQNSDQLFLDMGSGNTVVIGQPGSLSIQSVQFADGTVWDEWAMVEQMTNGSLPIDSGGIASNVSYSATLADGTAIPAWLTLNSATGAFNGTPDNWDVGSLSLRVTATGSDGNSVNSVFGLDVQNVNDAPTVGTILGGQSVLQDQAFSYEIPASAFDDVDFIHGDSLTYSAAMVDGSPPPAWLGFDAATGTFNGTPDNWDVGALDVVVTATDTGGLSASSAFSLDVVNTNDAPVSSNDSSQANEDDGSAVISGASLLANDADIDVIHGDSIAIASVSPTSAAGASVSLVNGDVVYDHTGLFQSLAEGQTTTDTFEYTIVDSQGATSTSTVTMTITGTNDAPIANPGFGAAIEDGNVVTLTGTELMANDTDIDQGDTMSIASVSVTSAAGASVSLVNGDVQYNIGNLFQELGEGQTTTDTFDYTIVDSQGVTSTSTVTMTITGTNDVPIVATDVAAVQEDLTVEATGNVLSNDFDIDQGDVLSVANAGVFTGTYGTLTLNADGSYGYTLDNASVTVQSLAEGQVVSESFDYQATDGITATPSTLTISITGTNDAPVVNIPLSDQEAFEAVPFSYQLPADAFTDIDQGDRLSYSATMVSGDPLPEWLRFDPVTQTFNSDMSDGSAAGIRDVRVTATDQNGSSAFSDFRLDVADLKPGTCKEDVISGSALRDVIYGFGDDDVLSGLGGRDVLIGGTGIDILKGGAGDDILIAEEPLDASQLGGAPLIAEAGCCDDEEDDDHGHDSDHDDDHGDEDGDKGHHELASNHEGGRDDDHDDDHGDRRSDDHKEREHKSASSNLLDGGAGNDILYGGAGSDMLIGGVGNDVIDTGTGSNVIAFNSGDGSDTVISGPNAENTISLGGGINFDDLALSQQGNDLILDIGTSDQITFRDWYASADNQGVDQLQIISESVKHDDDHHGSKHESKHSKLRSSVQVLDFGELVEQFEESGTADRWSLANARLDRHLQHSNDDADAVGGAMAGQYALTGTLDAMSAGSIQDLLDSSKFGTKPQQMNMDR